MTPNRAWRFKELLREQRKKKMLYKAAMCMAVMVVFTTTYMLILPAITMSRDAYCGQEHEHSLQCYSNPADDIETAADWEASLPAEVSSVVSERVLAVAESQLGYMESETNYQVDPESGIQRGYTRYGEWYGDPYSDWSILFAGFCLKYAGADDVVIPQTAEGQAWAAQLRAADGKYAEAETYLPYKGDIAFIDVNEDGTIDTAGIVAEVSVSENKLGIIEGDSANKVQLVQYELDSPAVNGYGVLNESGEITENGDTAVEKPVEQKILSYKDELVEIKITSAEGQNIPQDAELKVSVNSCEDAEYIDSNAESQLKTGQFIAEQQQYSLEIVDRTGPVDLQENLQVTMTYQPRETLAGSDRQARIMSVSESGSNTLAQADADGGEPVTAVFSTSRPATYNVMLLANASQLPEGKYGQFNFSYNEQKDAFIKDSAYGIYYNDNSPLGTAGSFHLVAFGTANLGTHTNGNVLAHTLIAGSNFGTNNYGYELSYAQVYEHVNGGSASMTDDHILVVGSDNIITVQGNNDQIWIGNGKLDRPYNVVQDIDTETAPFIDMDRVEAEIKGISDKLAAVSSQGLTINFSDENNRMIILNDSNSAGFYTTTAKELQAIPNFSDRKIRLKGFVPGHNGSIVINVDCAGVDKITLPDATIFVGDQEQSTNETTNFSTGKVIWNFINAEGVEITTRQMTGMIVAPGANVIISRNLNGTVVAENIKVEAESHRTDFTGDIEVPGEEEEELIPAYLRLRKVDADNISIHLDDAVFELYKWDPGAGQYVLEREALTYGSGEALVLNALTFNQAYRLVEVRAPDGYKALNTAYEFMISNEDIKLYPVIVPAEFSGRTFTNGQTLYYRNEKMYELVIEKQWVDSDGEPIDVDEESITVNLWRNVYSDKECTVLIRSEECRAGLSVRADEAWRLTISDLPAGGLENAGSNQTMVYYTYFVKEEQENDDYRISYEGNNGVTSGVITITNIQKQKFVIPKTGGPAGYMFIGGVSLMAAAFVIALYRRREAES